MDWYLTDAQGSVRDVVQGEVSGGAMTAEVVDHVIYTAYGDADRRGRLHAAVRLRWACVTTRPPASILTATRRYDPSTGTWIQPDPIGFLGGQDNLSEFVGNDPTNFVDPSGLGPISPWGDRVQGPPPGAQWWANGPNDIPIGMVWVYPGFGLYSSGGAYVPYYGCDCCEGGGFNDPSVAESLGPPSAPGSGHKPDDYYSQGGSGSHPAPPTTAPPAWAFTNYKALSAVTQASPHYILIPTGQPSPPPPRLSPMWQFS